MPSPFPGMDPFIDGQKWGGFHHDAITYARAALQRKLLPKCSAEIEERVYVEYSPHHSRPIIPDVKMLQKDAVFAGGGVASPWDRPLMSAWPLSRKRSPKRS